ncbi:hypothetical protein BDN72DRAFT_680729 [Pluteus cervinus]|uniref:Uncharacterized protein n=1 Tax=Pluteus cervinus TaxID=181527 RepID=A0ACD3AS24_9AGAR|nr:hypothetical protein BDN72DRAFT_680729 [Pluteus cervinus]
MSQELQAQVTTILAKLTTAHETGIQIDLSEQEYMTLGLSSSGKAGEERGRQRHQILHDNTWQADSFLGYCTKYHEEIHLVPIDDDYVIIYWGGRGAAANQLWSFQISRRRGNATVFDEDLDAPVDVAREGISISVQVSPRKFVELLQGKFHSPEEETILYKRTFPNRPPKTIPLVFPSRPRPPQHHPDTMFLPL